MSKIFQCYAILDGFGGSVGEEAHFKPVKNAFYVVMGALFSNILKPTFGNYSLVPIFAVLFTTRVCQTAEIPVKSPEKQA